MIELKTSITVFIGITLLLLVANYGIFRVLVRRNYQQHQRLTHLAAELQLLAFTGLICYPYLFNPPEWPWFWMLAGPTARWQQILGAVVIVIGFVTAFGSMFWFGLRRAFGLQAFDLERSGPYRFTRNPQVLFSYLMLVGVSLQYPSLYALLWIGLYGLACHWMIRSEEEHLHQLFGHDYAQYCLQTPRYVIK